MKKKGLRITGIILLIVVLAIVAGPTMPRPDFSPVLPEINVTPENARELIEDMESAVGNVRPGNQSQLFLANDSLPGVTEYVLLYLHGFSASPMEGFPIHLTLAHDFGWNAYVPRLGEHGLDTEDALLNMTPDTLWESAKQALVIARALGKKVILMGASTGGTLALKLAADYPDDIAGLVLYSPNIRIANKATWLLTKPWGLQIGRMIAGGKKRVLEPDPETDPYWYQTYRMEAVVYLRQLLDKTMKASLFQEIQVPTFVGYYYKDEENQDETVSVTAIKWMIENLGTDPAQIHEQAFPDAGAHVIGCSLTNPNWSNVYEETKSFLQNTYK